MSYHPVFAGALAGMAAPQSRLHAELSRIGTEYRAAEAHAANLRRAADTARYPPEPHHVRARKLALSAQSVLHLPYATWWQRKNSREAHLRAALLAHRAHLARQVAA